MCFETEEELRKKGKPKTPGIDKRRCRVFQPDTSQTDVLFLIPMGLAIPFAEGHVVNWIDSKGELARQGCPVIFVMAILVSHVWRC